jgi:aldehyde dehydrogenase (NAD+)
MSTVYTHKFDHATYKADVPINTGLFINNEWVNPVKPDFIE